MSTKSEEYRITKYTHSRKQHSPTSHKYKYKMPSMKSDSLPPSDTLMLSPIRKPSMSPTLAVSGIYLAMKHCDLVCIRRRFAEQNILIDKKRRLFQLRTSVVDLSADIERTQCYSSAQNHTS